MLCNSVRAVIVGVVFTPSVGWLEVVLEATETGPNSEKNFTNRQALKNAENSNCSVSTGFGSHVDDDDEAVCKLARDPDEVVCRFCRDPL